MGPKQLGEAVGSPGQEGTEVEMGKAHPCPHPSAWEEGWAHHPAACIPDGPRLPFDAAHHLELLQVPETDGPAKAARLCREARVLSRLQAGLWLGQPASIQTPDRPPTSPSGATESNAWGQGLTLGRQAEGIQRVEGEPGPLI